MYGVQIRTLGALSNRECLTGRRRGLRIPNARGSSVWIRSRLKRVNGALKTANVSKTEGWNGSRDPSRRIRPDTIEVRKAGAVDALFGQQHTPEGEPNIFSTLPCRCRRLPVISLASGIGKSIQPGLDKPVSGPFLEVQLSAQADLCSAVGANDPTRAGLLRDPCPEGLPRLQACVHDAWLPSPTPTRENSAGVLREGGWVGQPRCCGRQVAGEVFPVVIALETRRQRRYEVTDCPDVQTIF